MPITGPKLEKPVNFQNIFQSSLQIKPDEIALVSLRNRLTWRELETKSDTLARSLLAVGLVPGDRVASLMPNRWELVILYLACLKSGLVATPLNYRYMAPEIDHALDVSGARILIAHAEREADLAESNLVTSLPFGVIGYAAEDHREPNLEQMIETSPANIDLPAIDISAPLAIFFTSGSTGKPKGVIHTVETFSWMCSSLVSAVEIRSDDVVLPGSSISHVGGFMWFFACLSLGTQLIVARSFDGDEMLPILRDFKPTILSMIPAALFELIRDRHGIHDDFASLRLCVSGGDKISSVLEHEFMEKAGIIVSELFGMTEIGCSHFNHDKSLHHLGSVGTVADGFEVILRDDEDKEAALGEPGRLWVRANCTTAGYWNNEQATNEAYDDGWFDTGDIMKLDQDGYYWFCGRKKQIIVHNGSNICPQEVEEALQGHAAVEHAGVVGIHDLVHGENVIAYITLQAEAAMPSLADIIAFSKKRVGYKAPEEIVILDEMPFNATGKVDRVTLKKHAEEAHRVDVDVTA
ncbi:acyl--CoA ligase [Sneathiella marina]|uniref:Acyl--CoA ligase n=1 Tax=Sneathiella marina TaxID=2950108 RepID=A0ABY4W750_9PROT|nr:class I adenylate-forming enzyme family protein [Sneathiella marina]USG62671.1 acyl--CoA ligase [Sneathiella marina]